MIVSHDNAGHRVRFGAPEWLDTRATFPRDLQDLAGDYLTSLAPFDEVGR